MKKRDQNGIATVEIVLFVIIFVLIGFIALTDQTVSTSSKAPVAKSTASASKFTFKEFGVAITLPKELEGMTYETEELGNFMILNLTTPKFAQLGAICWAHDPVQGTKSFQTIQKKTTKYGSDGFVGTNLKQFDGFYIAGNELPSFDCEDSSKADEFKALGESLNSALNQAFKTATKIQQ
jgi:hypothetical protein